MTLKNKRECVQKFKAGQSMEMLAALMDCGLYDIERVIRAYMNGKFKLHTTKSGSQ